MVVEGVGDAAAAVGPLEELHVHADVLPGRDGGLPLRQELAQISLSTWRRGSASFHASAV